MLRGWPFAHAEYASEPPTSPPTTIIVGTETRQGNLGFQESDRTRHQFAIVLPLRGASGLDAAHFRIAHFLGSGADLASRSLTSFWKSSRLADRLQPEIMAELVGVVEAGGDVVAKGLDRPVRGIVDARVAGSLEARVR